MRKLPQKQSLVAQTAAVLRDEIRSGEWSNTLPAEHKLCERLVVGRSTLRAALACLKREGLVEARHGSGWEILRSKSARPAKVTKTLILLTPQSPHLSSKMFDTFWIARLREHLDEAGYHLDVRHEQAYYAARPERALEELARSVRPAGWVLHSVPRPAQRWFSARSLPCAIVGSRHPGIDNLPFVERDRPAAFHHAAGQLIAKGHMRIALLTPKGRFAGGPICERSFLDAAARFGTGGGQALIAHHDQTRENVCRQLGELLRQRPAVTGFLVTGSRHALTALAVLQREGLRLPQDAALISSDNDGAFLEHSVPSVAHYLTDPVLFARKVSRTVLRLAQGEEPPPDVRVMPRFIPGETFG